MMTPELVTGLTTGVSAATSAYVLGRLRGRRALRRLRRMLVVEQRSQESTGQPYALLLLDLDGFKRFNDEYGHAVGDQVLVEVGRRVRTITPADGIAVRLGGDELVVAAPAAMAVTARIWGLEAMRAITSSSMAIDELDLVVTASIGASWVVAGVPAHVALHATDWAMYTGKLTGEPVVFVDLALADADDVPTPEARPGTRVRELRHVERQMRGVAA
jgi:diguanylate cyclase (GGDEF)-like protein